MIVKVGSVMRMIRRSDSDSESQAFSDCYVAKIEGNIVTLYRPYVLSDGTTGTEVFHVFESSFDSLTWKEVQR